MKLEDRINAIAELGFTERQARFLDLVMLFGGLCVPRQYAAFAGTAYGRRVSRFFDKLVRHGYATVSDCLHNRAELYHLRHSALYRAIDQPHSVYRRPVPARQVVHRLMRLDAVVLQPDLIWLATEEEKVAFFSLMAPPLPRERLPHVMVGKGARGRLRLFPEDQPGVTTTGLVLPQQLADATAHFQGAVRDELTPLRPEWRAKLKWYFAKRRSTPSPRAPSFEDPDFWEHQASFSLPRFQQLYRRWLTDGDTVLEALGSPANTEALERGTGWIESRILLLPYRHLSPWSASSVRLGRGRGRGYIVRTVSTASIGIALRQRPRPCVTDATPAQPRNALSRQRLAAGAPA